MSQAVTKRVVLYSTASSEHPYMINNNNEEALLKTETLSSDAANKAIQLDFGTNQGSEIVLNVQSDEEPTASKTFVTTKTSRKVIRTYVTDTGETQQFTIQTTPVVSTSVEVEKHGNQVQNDTNIKNIFETELHSQHRETKDRDVSKIQMESQAYVSTKTEQQDITATNETVNEKNSISTNSSKTSNPRTSIKSSYTYRVKDGVAVLENVTKYRSQKRTKKERSLQQQTDTSTDYQQIDENGTEQSILTQTKPLEKTLTAFPNEEKIKHGPGHYKKETHPWPREEKQIPHNTKENAKNLEEKLKFIPIKTTHGKVEDPRYNSPKQRQNISRTTTTTSPKHTYTYQLHHHQDKKRSKTFVPSSPGRLVIPDFNQHSSTIEVKELTPPPTKVEKRKSEEWITQVTTQEEVRSEPPLQANRLSADKVQFLDSQDTQPVKKLDASSPGRLVIPDFSQHSSTIEVKELTPAPTKVEKRKSEEWIRQVATQEEVRSEPSLQANRLSADKVQFLHSRDTQRVKNLDASFPGKLVFYNFNQGSSEVVDGAPAGNSGRRTADMWNSRSMSYEGQRNSSVQGKIKELSRDSMLVHTHERQRLNSGNGRMPGKLVVHNLKESNSLACENDGTDGIPLRRGTEGNADVWISQSNKYGETESSELPSSIGKLSGDRVKFLHTQDVQPAIVVDRSLQHGHQVTPDVNHHHQNISVDGQKISFSRKEQKPKFEQWSTTTRPQVLREDEPASREIRLPHRVELSRSQNGHGAERNESVSLGKLVIPDSKQHSFSVNIQQYSPGLETEKQNSQQCITKPRTHEEPRLKLSHGSSAKVQAYSTYTEPATALDGSTLGGVVIVDVQHSQDSSPSQVQEVIPPPTVKKNNTEQWTTQIIAHEGLQSEGPGTIQFLANHEGHPISTSESVSSANVTVAPGFQHSFSIQRQDGEHSGEELIQRQTTTRLRTSEIQLANSGEGQQVITLDGSSDGTVVIPIQIEHVLSPAHVQIRNG